MFWRKKPTVDYAIQDFQRMMHLLRRWAKEFSTEASEEEIYSISLLVLTYFAYCFNQTSMPKSEIFLFSSSCAQELMLTFRKSEAQLGEDGPQMMRRFEAHGMYFGDAARETYTRLKSTGKITLAEKDFVTVCSSACAGIVGKLQKDGFMST